ncbi:MAG TPA: site-2 protease family protein [Pseudogracilibacillus sp.]|nr:site-2 protease family protein [Pseudogracilibacillus sp.]
MSFFIHLFLFVFLFVPISLFFHELGHALMALVFRASNVSIHIGRGKHLCHLTLRRFSLWIYMNVFLYYMTEYERTDPFTHRERIMIALMGPIVNGLIGFTSFLLYKELFTNKVLLFCTLFNWWLMIANLFPFKIGQKQSDGYTIYTLLFK